MKALAVVGLPWDPTPNVDAEDGARLPNPEVSDAEVIPKDPEIPEAIVRKMYIRKADIIKYGDAWMHRLPMRGSWEAIAVTHHRMS